MKAIQHSFLKGRKKTMPYKLKIKNDTDNRWTGNLVATDIMSKNKNNRE